MGIEEVDVESNLINVQNMSLKFTLLNVRLPGILRGSIPVGNFRVLQA